MLDEEAISETLEALADRRTASRLAREVRPLKGVRGVPHAEIAKLAAGQWSLGTLDLDRDGPALERLFGAAWEDGLVAVGLVAAALPDDPEAAVELGLRWLEHLDDPYTADALGWLVLGPGVLAGGRPLSALLSQLGSEAHPAARRAVAMAAMAMLPVPVEGPAAAPVRARVGEKHVQFVEQALPDGLAAIADGVLRDEDPSVRKALRRVLRVWAKADPASLGAWADTVRGGFPRILGDEVKKARRRAEREA